MNTPQHPFPYSTRRPLDYAILILSGEKIIQHTLVTLAFYFNWKDIASTVAVNPDLLMVLGAMLTVLFGIAFAGMIRLKSWAIRLVLGLAIFDFLAEFLAQGRLWISITVSFLVAILLIILAIASIRLRQKSDKAAG